MSDDGLTASPAGQGDVHARTCLILELDGASLDPLRLDLERVGFDSVGAFGSAREAVGWLDGNTPDLAVLDLAPADGEGLTVASILKERGVPILVYSAHRPPGQLPDPVRGAPWLLKPAGLMALRAAIWKLAGLHAR